MGTNGDDVLRGTAAKDVIVGLDGDDQIFGFGGGDILCGGPGRDRIEGGPGKDLIFGAGGGDRLFGGPGDDVVLAERGSDRAYGGRGNDLVDGGVGVDRLYGDSEIDSCITDVNDVFLRRCEGGNYKQFAQAGDQLFRPRLDADDFPVAEHCFTFTNRCDQFYVARIRLDGNTTFDALGIEAFNQSGDTIATYTSTGDRFRGVFLFSERPVRIQVDSGGGAWEILFLQKSGLRIGTDRTSGDGHQVYVVKRPVRGTNVTATAEWDGFGHFAVVGVSPADGRDLLVNEVRFDGQSTPPFNAEAVAETGIALVQVLSDEGDWTVTIQN